MNEEVLNRITALENKFRLLEQSSTIPYEIENALKGRGFLKSDNLFITGSVTISNPSGAVRVPMPNVSKKCIVLVTSNNAAPGSIPQGVMTDESTLIPGVSDLYITGSDGDIVNYIIFLTSDYHPEQL